MAASLDMAVILEETDRLSRLLVCSEEAEYYRSCKQQLTLDREAQALIEHFVKKKEEFEEVQRFGRYHPDYDRIRKEMRHIKRTLDLNDSVAQFKKAEQRLQSVLNEVSEIIAAAVSDTIKVPTGNPYFDQVGCGGGCSGGCASCGN